MSPRRVVIATACLLLAACTKGAPPASLLDAGAPASSVSVDAVASADAGALSLPLDAGAPPAPVDELQARAKKLFEAIQKDEPEIAMAMFFPREPFLALKDVKDPSAYWDKLVKEYKAHIHSYHKKLGKKAAEAEFEGFELNPKSQVYVAPKKEFNKTGYNKVTKSKLRYKLKGKTRTLDVATMIDHESKWYVTHLKQ
ncbi:MAG: hypothetical protein HYV09_08225 [Deltaproteobacteria bacterium]|nr:hypothetical protein [Deltaproteobacteria bacterium]